MNFRTLTTAVCIGLFATSSFANAGRILVLRQRSGNEFIQVKVIENDRYVFELCDSQAAVAVCQKIGHEDGYTLAQLNQRISELNSQYWKGEAIKAGVTLVGFVVGTLLGGGAGHRYFGPGDGTLVSRFFGVYIPALLGGIAGGTVGFAGAEWLVVPWVTDYDDDGHQILRRAADAEVHMLQTPNIISAVNSLNLVLLGIR